MVTQIQPNNLTFVREVARYFMDFLETDFHKRRNPKRSVHLHDNSNLLVGINLAKYPSFASVAWKALGQGFANSPIVARGSHRTPLPDHLIDATRLRAKALYQQDADKIFSMAGKAILDALQEAGKDYEKAVSESLKGVTEVIRARVANPLILDSRSSFERLGLGDEASIAMLAEELCSVLTSLVESAIAGIVRSHISGEEIDVLEQMRNAFDARESMSCILTYFEGLQVADLYTEILEMERNRNILDKHDFYLYFCDITYNGAKYPVFYIPFVLVKRNGELSLEFDAQVYLNKKALEFISQEYNREEDKKGSLRSTGERIIYLASCGAGFRDLAHGIINELIDFFGLDKEINLSDPHPQTAKSPKVRVSNSCHVALFEKADEALVNDYEEILNLLAEGGGILAGAFEKLIGDSIHNNPVFINMEVEDDWDAKNASEKLVFRSPIPLNSEQLQILAALKKDNCRYVTVEGPPGTGKSHTITAVVFDAIMNDQSVLVLSDKKEALDVVEDKITETLNKVRLDRNFQNPILRLGRAGAVFTNAAMDAIRTQFRATRNEKPVIEKNIDSLTNGLITKLTAEIRACSSVTLQDIFEHSRLEAKLSKLGLLEHMGEIADQLRRNTLLGYLHILQQVGEAVRAKMSALDTLNGSPRHIRDLRQFKLFLMELTALAREIRGIWPENEKELSQLKRFKRFSEKHLKDLDGFVAEYRELKHPLFGYLFKSKKVEKLNTRFKSEMRCTGYEKPHRCVDELKRLSEAAWNFCVLKEQLRENALARSTDMAVFIHRAIKDDGFLSDINHLINLLRYFMNIEHAFAEYPGLLMKTGLGPEIFENMANASCLDNPRQLIDTAIHYAELDGRIRPVLHDVFEVDYIERKRQIEELATLQMTHIMDGRAVDFYDRNRATAAALRNIIKSKQKFPREEFKLLKEAFPCILAGIRDYAEYIPLEPEMFDLVVIDEASQVSIAQSLPALLRARKVLILGDRKQFSNVKTAQARTDTNREYLNRLKEVFVKCVSNSPTKLVRMEKFNIKTSILEFFEFIANYRTPLLKHFRGYKELISYSNKNFYDGTLQVMKIRGKPADEVIKFSVVEHDGKTELMPNTNVPEINFIIADLQRLKESDSTASIGIITPHTNQQKKLMEMISARPEKDYWFDDMKLKIMTFDTCQGEERDIVYYSMVATNSSDRLGHVFIKDLSSVNLEDDSVIRAQRLNVGFSRVKECMHFVLSKPPENYSGAIGEAIRHYCQALKDAKKERRPAETDARSLMEPIVLNWFYQTDFWKRNRDLIELFPQFEIGKYLKQLDRNYNHPAYKVDFLLLCRKAGDGAVHRVIIEYDGFLEHFGGRPEGDTFGGQVYYSESDIYRQRVLESYGYKFLRINKFNIGKDPISTLNRRLGELIFMRPQSNNAADDIVDRIHGTAEGLQNGGMKVCPKCGEARILEEFRDLSLVTGYGRYCRKCKGK